MSIAHPERFGEVEVLILETEDKPITDEPGIQPTAAADWKSFVPLKRVISSIAESISGELSQAAKDAAPDEVSVTMSLGLSGNGWLIGVGGEGKVSLTFKWSKKNKN